MFDRIVTWLSFIVIIIGLWQYISLNQAQGLAMMGMGYFIYSATEDNMTIKWFIGILGTLYIACSLILAKIEGNRELLLEILKAQG